MPTLPYRIYDADNHYYEPDDCFTRHIESQWKTRTVRVERDGAGPGRMFVGDERCHFFSVGAGDSVGPPGAMKAVPARRQRRGRLAEPARDERARGARVRRAQGATRGDGRAERRGVPDAADHRRRRRAAAARAAHRDALYPSLRAFNRWLEEDWGYGGDGRIYGAPLCSLADVGEADRRARSPARARRALRGADHRPDRRPLARRSALRSVLGALPGSRHQRRLPHRPHAVLARSTTCRGDCGRIRRRTATR